MLPVVTGALPVFSGTGLAAADVETGAAAARAAPGWAH